MTQTTATHTPSRPARLAIRSPNRQTNRWRHHQRVGNPPPHGSRIRRQLVAKLAVHRLEPTLRTPFGRRENSLSVLLVRQSPSSDLLGRGEYARAMTYIGEHSPDRTRGSLSGWLPFGTLSGYICGAALVTGLTSGLPNDALMSWGWRIPFLVGAPLAVVGLYMRLRLEETPAYTKLGPRNGPAAKAAPNSCGPPSWTSGGPCWCASGSC